VYVGCPLLTHAGLLFPRCCALFLSPFDPPLAAELSLLPRPLFVGSGPFFGISGGVPKVAELELFTRDPVPID